MDSKDCTFQILEKMAFPLDERGKALNRVIDLKYLAFLSNKQMFSKELLGFKRQSGEC